VELGPLVRNIVKMIELTKATPKSQLGKKLDKIALAVNYELSKKSRGGDGSTFAPIEGTPPWIKPLDSNAKASLPQKQAAGNANLMNLPTTGKLQLESQESSSSPSSRSSSSESFSNNSSSTEKRDNTVTTLSLTDPEQFPLLAASSRKRYPRKQVIRQSSSIHSGDQCF
jgi:hypothetical protein